MLFLNRWKNGEDIIRAPIITNIKDGSQYPKILKKSRIFAGLIIGPILYKFFTSQEINISISNSFYLLAVAGLLVGAGTRISGGCTSGHGISGVGRFSLRSIVATVTFMIVGILTVLVKNLIWIRLYL